MNQAVSAEAAEAWDEESPLAQTAANPNTANPARVYDALLGGKDNYAADRVVADKLAAAKPALRPNVRANRAYLGRVVRYLATEAGIRQFLDLGTGLPSLDNTHEVAQRAAAESRIVYVDNDPVVLAHARALLVSGTHEGATAYLQADIREPASILEQASATLDFSKPVAVMLLGVLYMIPDFDRPYETVDAYVDALESGKIQPRVIAMDEHLAALGPRFMSFVKRDYVSSDGFFYFSRRGVDRDEHAFPLP